MSAPDPAASIDNAAFDRQVVEYEQLIREQDVLTKPYVGDLTPLAALESEFANGTERVQAKIVSLQRLYQRIRTTRPDGNCFYRGFMFALCEWLMTLAPEAEVERVVAVFERSKADLLAHGFDDIIVDFWDVVMATLRRIRARTINADELLEVFRDPTRSEYMVYYLRYVTSAHVRKNAILYEEFALALGFATLEQFITAEIDAIGRDADNLQIAALLAYIEVGAAIAYLDQSHTADGTISVIRIPDDKEPVVHLLYRPGHYDVLYL